MFAFQFINSYSGLLYVAFWKRDLNRLRTLLMTMMIVKQSLRKLIETYKPVVARWMKDRKEKKEVKVGLGVVLPFARAIIRLPTPRFELVYRFCLMLPFSYCIKLL